jgi:hypothetical protein
MNDHHAEPRPGLPGVWDRLAGPGASTFENLDTAEAALLGALA